MPDFPKPWETCYAGSPVPPKPSWYERDRKIIERLHDERKLDDRQYATQLTLLDQQLVDFHREMKKHP